MYRLICQKPTLFCLPKWLWWASFFKCLYYLGCIPLVPSLNWVTKWKRSSYTLCSMYFVCINVVFESIETFYGFFCESISIYAMSLWLCFQINMHRKHFLLVLGRDIHIECSKQFKRNSYFYVSGQSRPFWAALKLL